MQVLVGDAEYKQLQESARSMGMSLGEWVRQTLRRALRSEPSGTVDVKLERIRSAVAHSFPAPEIDQMLDEIARGYSVETTE